MAQPQPPHTPSHGLPDPWWTSSYPAEAAQPSPPHHPPPAAAPWPDTAALPPAASPSWPDMAAPPPPASASWPDTAAAPPAASPPLGPPAPRPGAGAAAAPAADPRRARRRAGVAMALVAVLSLVGGTAGGWFAGRESVHRDAGTTVPVTIVRASDRSAVPTMDVAAVVAAVEPSVVSIESTITTTSDGGGWGPGSFGSQTGTGTAAGSGVIISAGGEVVTNAHVISGATSIQVTTNAGRKYQATVVGTDTSHDLALLKLEGASGLTPATLGASSSVKVGDDVVAIGNALALEGGPTVTRGIVSALGRSIETEDNTTLDDLIQTDAAISSGNSGGPLVNASGQVVGINSAVATSSGSVAASNVGFAISVDTVRSQLPKLRAGH